MQDPTDGDGTAGSRAHRPPVRPRLRPLDIFPFEQDGEAYLGLRDPSGLSEDVAVLPRSSAAILSLLDGHHDLAQIQTLVARRYRQHLSIEALRAFIANLDDGLWLDSPRYQQARARAEQAFLDLSTRPAALAGRSYPAASAELGTMIDGFFSAKGGAGTPVIKAGTTGAHPSAGSNGNTEVRAVIAPHIDYHRGGPLYGWAYRHLAETTTADLFVVFGTGHAAGDALLTLTRKAFETPFGEVPTDGALADELASASGLGDSLFADELLHRNEHSIEFQAVMLRRVLGGRPFQMLPVLCGSLHDYVAPRRGGRRADVSSDDRIGKFLEALAQLTRGKRVAFIAGADLAHIGPAFGDADEPDAKERRDLEHEDREKLDACLLRDAGGFFERVAADGDRRRICGLSPIYLMLRAMGAGASGQLLAYAQCPDPRASLVSCASVEYLW
jgi:AmmeMemoRadiSam system protein B